MTLQEECRLSYYEEVRQLSQNHNVFLVRHQESQQLFVRKVLTAYNLEIYHYLKDHPIDNTPKIYDLIEDEGRLIVIEEYIEGKTIQEILDKHANNLPQDWTYRIIVQLCHIVENLHKVHPPIIHRDIKPSNIIVTDLQEVKLLDLNAAHLVDMTKAEDTVLMGTKGYAAPEQYGFGQSDVRTDVFALGRLLEQLCPDNKRYDAIVSKATQIDPGKRFQSVQEFEEALRITSFLDRDSVKTVLMAGIVLTLVLIIVVCFGNAKGKGPEENTEVSVSEMIIAEAGPEDESADDMAEKSITTEIDEIQQSDDNERGESVKEPTVSDVTENEQVDEDAGETKEPAITPEPTISPLPTLEPTATPTPTPPPTSTPSPTNTPTPTETLPERRMINGIETRRFYYEGFYFYIPTYYVNQGQWPDSNAIQFMPEGRTLRFSDLGADSATLVLSSMDQFYEYADTPPSQMQAIDMSLKSGFLIIYRKLAECLNMEIAGYPATKVTILGDQGSGYSDLATSKVHIYDAEHQKTIIFGVFLETTDEMNYKFDFDELIKYIYHE